MPEYNVCVVGGGVAGLTASTFTARAALETVVVDDGGSILRRNAHLENFPGFPAGVDARRFLERSRAQAEAAGVTFVDGRVADVAFENRVEDVDATEDADAVEESDAVEDSDASDGVVDYAGPFTVALEDGSSFDATRVVAASWSDASYLPAGVEAERRGSKTFVDVDETGRTTVDGIYAAGRLADQYHQAVICAGHGGTVGVTVVHDSDEAYYHDWVTPEGYFTGRGRDVPPGCEEIADAERRERDATARDANAAYTVPLDDEPEQHPSVAADDDH